MSSFHDYPVTPSSVTYIGHICCVFFGPLVFYLLGRLDSVVGHSPPDCVSTYNLSKGRQFVTNNCNGYVRSFLFRSLRRILGSHQNDVFVASRCVQQYFVCGEIQ